jgi:hypothetical protein
MSINVSTDDSRVEVGIGVMIKKRRKVEYQLNLKGWWSFTLDLIQYWWESYVLRRDG